MGIKASYLQVFDPLLKNSEKLTRFHLVSISGDLQVVKYFIEELQTNIAFPGGKSNFTPLHFARHQLEVLGMTLQFTMQLAMVNWKF